MFSWMTREARMPTAEEALPGRATRISITDPHHVLGTKLEEPFPPGHERAVFGMGCFWGAERKFWQAEGVHVTAVGYAAGHTPNPTYQEVCSGSTGHNEVVLVVFDPAVTSFETMLRIFWENHDPTQGMRQGNDVGTQYRSGIYVFDEQQRSAAEASRASYQEELSRAGYGSITTEILDAPDFYHRRRRRLLLRRAVPPAVSFEESGRLLRIGWNGCRLPGGPDPELIFERIIVPVRAGHNSGSSGSLFWFERITAPDRHQRSSRSKFPRGPKSRVNRSPRVWEGGRRRPLLPRPVRALRGTCLPRDGPDARELRLPAGRSRWRGPWSRRDRRAGHRSPCSPPWTRPSGAKESCRTRYRSSCRRRSPDSGWSGAPFCSHRAFYGVSGPFGREPNPR